LDGENNEMRPPKRLLFSAAVLVVILVAIGCPGRDSLQASLGKEFSLSIGQSASISSDKLSVRFLDVTDDSRCPEGVTCIWAGQVSCLVEVTTNGKTDQAKLTATGGNSTSSQSVSGYAFAFNMVPYPAAGKPITKGEYRLNLTVVK
jgi:hypothetical protein